MKLTSLIFVVCFSMAVLACDSSSGGGKGDATDSTSDSTSDTTTTTSDDTSTSTSTDTAVDIPEVQNRPECVEVCPRVVAAGCAEGPPSIDDCVEGCNGMYVYCAAQMEAFMSCVGNRAIECIQGQPSASGCDTQAAALFGCLDDLD